MYKTAADVNADQVINPLDALYINRRYIGIIHSFKSGDWLFDKVEVKIDGAGAIVNLRAVCFGDVNGSYNPRE